MAEDFVRGESQRYCFVVTRHISRMVVQRISYINMQNRGGLEPYVCLSGLGKRGAANSGQATNQAQLVL